MNIYMLIAQTQGSLAAMSLPSRQASVLMAKKQSQKEAQCCLKTYFVPRDWTEVDSSNKEAKGKFFYEEEVHSFGVRR